MAGFFGQLAQAAGQNITEGQAFDTRQANLEEQQQHVAANKMNMMQAQQRQKTQQDVGKMIQARQLADKTTVDDPAKMAKMYNDAAAIEMAGGNFQGAEQMSNLAKGKMKEASDAKEQVIGKIAQSKEEYAQDLQAYNDNPSAESAGKLHRSAAAAGVNLLDLPEPKSAIMAGQIQSAQMGTMTAKQQLDFTEKKAEFKDAQDQRKLVHEDSEKNILATRQAAAAAQAGLNNNRALDRAEDRRQFDIKQAAATGGTAKQTGPQQMANDAVIQSTSEIVQQLKTGDQFDAGVTSGLVADLKDKTLSSSVVKALGNTLTSQQAQQYTANRAGIAQEYARVLTLGAGKGANQAVIDELKEAVTAKPGDTMLTAAFKTATMTDAIRARNKTTRDSTSPKLQAESEASMAYLNSLPTAADVLAYGKKMGNEGNLKLAQGTMQKAQDAMRKAPNTDPAKDAAFQTAFDKYK